MITKLQEEKEDLERKVGELEEETKKNKEVKEENEKMRRKVEELEEKLSGRVEEMEVFLGQKERKVLITGDSHMKAISVERLKSDTKTNVCKDVLQQDQLSWIKISACCHIQCPAEQS